MRRILPNDSDESYAWSAQLSECQASPLFLPCSVTTRFEFITGGLFSPLTQVSLREFS
ncbi:hypothetical protein MOKP118_14440 [Mycobacterium avium subsp. hominissuis]